MPQKIKIRKEDLEEAMKLIEEMEDELDTIKNKVPEETKKTIKNLESGLATLDVLIDPEAMKQIRKSEKDIKKGKYKPLEELEKELQ